MFEHCAYVNVLDCILNLQTHYFKENHMTRNTLHGHNITFLSISSEITELNEICNPCYAHNILKGACFRDYFV